MVIWRGLHWKAVLLILTVQRALVHSDVQSKSDKSPGTVADYGSQALVSLVLKMELPSESFSLVAEEDSGDLCMDGAQETLRRITKLVNNTLLMVDIILLCLRKMCLLPLIVANLKGSLLANIGFWAL
ncbi:SAL1 phosphatase-like [Phoenix dactylifera]|uniref:SAL1 phosphatase-like n=1 Tax=Phoenix dactylifera TaxID=42345 RepID=A0A8B9ARV8_PHODC|nr:SAL1 phosphatase-like [Phoenix dactylifera]